jgi:transglutaminase-like putative cysteine protease
MNYQISHTTSYEYHEMVATCQNIVRLTPRAVPRQSCHHHRLLVRPSPTSLNRRTDYFGNPVTYFSISEGHRKLSITSMSRVEVRSTGIVPAAESPPWETIRDALPRDRGTHSVNNFQFCFDSPHIARSADLAAYASESFAPGRPVLEAVVELSSRVHADFTYDKHATTVHTPLVDVFAKRRGVCQDLAHVQIGSLRSLGLAARYVSGYLRTLPPPGQPRLVGADASHAWVAVYCGPLGWVDVDPTNDVVVDTHHITIAWGRDYGDVCPINGVFIGGGPHVMNVSADVQPLDDASEEILGPDAARVAQTKTNEGS